MKRLLLAALLAIGLSFPAWAAPPQSFFEGLRLGDSKEAVLQKLEKKYQFIQEESKGRAALFEGYILDESGKILTYFSPTGNLTNIILAFDNTTPSYEQLFQKYSFYRSMLEQKYGVPDISRRRFAPPYKAGDGQELTALREKKAQIISIWKVGKTPVSCSIMSMEPQFGPSVLILYGDPNQLKSP